MTTADIPEKPGPSWTTTELQEEFEVVGYAAPYVVVIRRADKRRGTLEFTHSPRLYFNWVEDWT